MTEWLDRVAADLLIVEDQVRTALRAAARGKDDPHLKPGGIVALNTWQARTLLRGVMPAAIALTARRASHARLSAALHHAAAQLLTLNGDTNLAHHRLDPCIAAACDLMTEAREWVRLARWEQATRAARVNAWRAPLSLTAVKRLVTKEQVQNTPSAMHGLRHHPLAGIRYLEGIAQRRQHQLDLALPLPPSAEVIDLRQLSLALPTHRAA